MSRPLVSAVVVTYQSEDCAEACLASLRAEARRLPLEAIVVDNASRDGSVAAARRGWPEARAIRAGENRGFAWAVNQGARAAAGEHLLLLNPDAILRPRAVAELVAALAADPAIGIVGPRIVDARGHLELSWGPPLGLLGELWQKALGRLHAARLPPVEAWLAWRSHRPRAVAWLSGACLLLPLALFRELGGMDETFFLYLEDVDLCVRAGAAGREVRYWPRAEVVHHRGRSAASDPERARRAYRRSQLHFYRKHHSPEAAALLRLYLRTRHGRLE